MAAAAAFCLLLVLGRPLDTAFNLTQWPEDEDEPGELALRDDARPNPDAGIELGLFWLGLFVLCYFAGYAYATWLRPRLAKARPAREREGTAEAPGGSNQAAG